MVRVTVLGSGDAFGSGGRFHSAHLVEAPGVTFLLDCGPSVLQALKRCGRAPAGIDFVLISHLHGDHFGGLPFLFMEYRYAQPRTRPLTLAGPPGIAAGVERLFEALYQRIAATESPFHVVYDVLAAGGGPRDIQGVRIEAFVVPHVEDLTCFAYRVTVGGKTILFSGDSGWTDDFLKLARGVDLFLCECSSFDSSMPIHVAYTDVAARAQQLGCKRLVLTHLGQDVIDRADQLSLECAHDGLTIEL
jgi:ribonuclease BN (tRNA processing enzyme)